MKKKKNNVHIFYRIVDFEASNSTERKEKRKKEWVDRYNKCSFCVGTCFKAKRKHVLLEVLETNTFLRCTTFFFIQSQRLTLVTLRMKIMSIHVNGP